MLRDVELVEGDQRVGVLAYRPDVGRPHVHRHHLDLLAARLAHRVEVVVKGRPVATVGHIQHARLRLRQVIDHRDIFVPSLKRRLVDADERRRRNRASRQTPRYRTLLDARHLVPTEPAPARHCRDAGHLQPLDHHHLEQRREARLRVRPRDRHLLDPMLAAPHSWNLRPYQRPILHRVQMPPQPRPPVVARTRRTACRAQQPLAHKLHPDLDIALLEGEPHAVHPPRPLDAQQPFIQSRLGHPASVLTGRTATVRP